MWGLFVCDGWMCNIVDMGVGEYDVYLFEDDGYMVFVGFVDLIVMDVDVELLVLFV